MADIARELGVVPAALYRHFSSKSEVLAAVSNRLYARLELDLTDPMPWQEGVMRWAIALRKLLHEFPTLERVYSWDEHFSSDWLRFTAQLGHVLATTGLEGPLLARNMIWVMRTVASYVSTELESRNHPPVVQRAELSDLSDEDAQLFAALIPHLETYSVDDQFTTCMEKMIAAVELDLEDDSRTASPGSG